MITEEMLRREWRWEPVGQLFANGPMIDPATHILHDALIWRGAVLAWVEQLREDGPLYTYVLLNRRGAGVGPFEDRKAAIEQQVIDIMIGDRVPGEIWPPYA